MTEQNTTFVKSNSDFATITKQLPLYAILYNDFGIRDGSIMYLKTELRSADVVIMVACDGAFADCRMPTERTDKALPWLATWRPCRAFCLCHYPDELCCVGLTFLLVAR